MKSDCLVTVMRFDSRDGDVTLTRAVILRPETRVTGEAASSLRHVRDVNSRIHISCKQHTQLASLMARLLFYLAIAYRISKLVLQKKCSMRRVETEA